MKANQNNIQTFLFDLDGVIRIYLEEDTAKVERKYKLDLGTINKIAFSQQLLSKVTTGQLTRLEWVKLIGEKIGNIDAALEWENRPVYIDTDVINIVRDLTFQDFNVFLITNGTDNLLKELRNLGIDKEFKYIFNSSDLGFEKPSLKIYQYVLNFLRINSDDIAYIDDNKQNVESASSLGFLSLQYKNVEMLKKWLNDL